MKKNKLRLVILVTISIFSFSSCSDYLDKEPDDQLSLDLVFENKTNVEKWLAGIYSGVPDVYSYGMESIGDDVAPSTRWEQYGFWTISYQQGNWSASSTGWDKNYWLHLPKQIRSGYIFLENVKPLPDQNLKNTEVEYMKAEVRFLIAYYHYLMLTYYGSIPILEKAQDVNSMNELLVNQQPFDKVVDWIETLLVDASNVLPPSYSDNRKYGRITSVMCKAIRARLLLFAASPLVNGNSAMKDVVNNEGIPIFNSTPSLQKWTRAAEASEDLINYATANGHKLFYEYLSSGEIDPFMSYQNVMLKGFLEGNTEILMARPDCQYNNWDIVTQPRGTGGTGAISVTQTLVDAFFMKNGLPPINGYDASGLPVINPESGYTEKGFSSSDEVRKTHWKEVKGNALADENKITLAGTYNMYCNREPRFYISVLYNGSWINSAGRLTDFYLNGKDGGPSPDSPPVGYLMRKRTDPDANPVNNTFKQRVGIIYRLAEAYLTSAEALNEADYGANKTKVVNYLNLIRERAGIPLYGNGQDEVTIPTDQAAMRKAIHQERRVELNCEAVIRFDDVRRWKDAEKALNTDFWGMNFSGTKNSDDKNDPEAYFVRKVYQTRKFKSYWFPVPQSELDRNPNLRQLPGW
ncbi:MULTISPECIES: RagB/SusD family nutrient uptake outer membrane protein [Bacteroidales]|uniref:RagB/SusD family nutrient uptake outer membrane protein n=1 Tax=Bacteroidales TaxID=171549 RepID=UPI0009B98BA7|nr:MULTISPECIES: RagB/SusD family nutrient uptake outer membrane protein [Bacteroidales]ULB35468.1 RagB/SusD family nutrient uptake outer membrane protein [Proteiniphilum propionicum]